MASFKRLKRSDVISVPYVANKNWVFEYCPYPENDQNIVIYKGTNMTGSFDIDRDPVTEGQYERLVYSQINHLYYQQYSSSVELLDTGSLLSSLYYDGVSQVRATGSYFNYNDNSSLIKNFPTGSMEGIRVLSINQDIYGQQILPYYFELSSSLYYIKDDGIGNLYDYSGSVTHVGNIFYSHGLSIITNQDYQLMFPLPPLAGYKELTFLDTDSSKLIDLTGVINGRGATIDLTSISLFNYNYDLFTDNNDGTLTLSATTPGTYITNYKFDATITDSNCADNILTSNSGKVKINVVPDCSFVVFINENPYPSPSPTPSLTPSVTPSLTPTITPSISISATPSVTPSVTPTIPASTTPSVSITPTTSVTPSITPSITPSLTPSISATPISRPILLSNAPGEATSGAACAITTGLTKYISISWSITNGLVMYNDATLTNKTYTNDPYSGNYAMLYDTNNSLRYAVTFDSSGNVNTVTNC